MFNFKISKIALAAAYTVVALGSVATVNVSTATVAEAGSSRCGGNNQKMCKPWQQILPCDKGYWPNIRGKCSRPNIKPPSLPKPPFSKSKELRNQASGMISNTVAHQRALEDVGKCMGRSGRKNAFEAAVKQRDIRAASRKVFECIDGNTLKVLRTAPRGAGQSSKFFNTVSVGVAGGGMAGVGLGAEAGIVLDLNVSKGPRLYSSAEWSFGAGLSAGADVVVSISRDRLERGKTKGQAVVASGKYLAGGGISINFNRGNPFKSDLFDGMSVMAGAGAGANIGTIHRSSQRIW